MALDQLHRMRQSTQGPEGPAYTAKITVPAGEVHALVGLPSGRSITVDVEVNGGTANVYTTLEDDDTVIIAGSTASTWVREWPAGAVTASTQDVFSQAVYALVFSSVTAATTFRVRC